MDESCFHSEEYKQSLFLFKLRWGHYVRCVCKILQIFAWNVYIFRNTLDIHFPESFNIWANSESFNIHYNEEKSEFICSIPILDGSFDIFIIK